MPEWMERGLTGKTTFLIYFLITRSNRRLCCAFDMLAIEEHAATTRLGCVLLPLSARANVIVVVEVTQLIAI